MQVVNHSAGNSYIADILNAQLRLPNGNAFVFRSEKPITGITEITVTNFDANTIRVTVTGEAGVPTVELFDSEEGLIFGILSAAVATPPQQQPQTQSTLPRVEPGSETEPDKPDNFTAGAILRDGFRVNDNLGTQETANIERIEVLKGPSSVLYGQNDPGGIINLVTKRPLSDPFYKLEFQAGSFGLIRPSIDITGPLTEDRSLRYRLNVAYQREDGFRDFETDTERFFIAPVLSWDISERTNLSVVMEYNDEENPFDLGIPAFGNGVVDVPSDRIVGEPDDFLNNRSLTLGYDLKHKLSSVTLAG